MGFFRRIFGAKKPPSNDKRRWSFSRSTNSSRINDNSKRDSLQSPIANPHENDSDATKHAIAVAAATAVAAEAAIAAAHAAAEVVRLTGGGCDGGSGVGRCSSTRNVRPFQSLVTVELAAVKIQSGFRGYLARRALRALKALVKLQALVRGYIVRKQTADMLRRMQTLVRLQAHARATRTNSSASRRSNSNSFYPPTHNIPTGTTYRNRVTYAYASGTGYDDPSILKRCDSTSNYRDIVVLDKAKLGLNWFNNQMNETVRDNQGITSQRNRQNDDEKSVKILEVDTWKPHRKSKQTEGFFQAQLQSLALDQNDLFFTTLDSPSKLSTEAHNAMLHMASAEVSPLTSTIMPLEVNESIIRTTKSSPYGLTTSSRAGGDSARGLFTPTRSECALSLFNQHLGSPNYMANTESSRAKVRSQSAPRQRLEFEKYSRRSLQGLLDTDTVSEREFAPKPKIRSKATPPPSHLNRVRSSNLRQ